MKMRFWIIPRSPMYGWVGCVPHKSRACNEHRLQYIWHYSRHAKHSSHLLQKMLCGSLICFLWMFSLLSKIINVSWEEFKFYNSFLYLKLPSTVLNTQLALIKKLVFLGLETIIYFDFTTLRTSYFITEWFNYTYQI